MSRPTGLALEQGVTVANRDLPPIKRAIDNLKEGSVVLKKGSSHASYNVYKGDIVVQSRKKRFRESKDSPAAFSSLNGMGEAGRGGEYIIDDVTFDGIAQEGAVHTDHGTQFTVIRSGHCGFNHAGKDVIPAGSQVVMDVPKSTTEVLDNNRKNQHNQPKDRAIPFFRALKDDELWMTGLGAKQAKMIMDIKKRGERPALNAKESRAINDAVQLLKQILQLGYIMHGFNANAGGNFDADSYKVTGASMTKEGEFLGMKLDDIVSIVQIGSQFSGNDESIQFIQKCPVGTLTMLTSFLHTDASNSLVGSPENGGFGSERTTQQKIIDMQTGAFQRFIGSLMGATRCVRRNHAGRLEKSAVPGQASIILLNPPRV